MRYNILGIGFGSSHASGASIISDGRLVTSIEEERISRVKEDGGFPYKSIEHCLKKANLQDQDIDLVVVGWENEQNKEFMNLLLNKESLNPGLLSRRVRYIYAQKVEFKRYLEALKSRFHKGKVVKIEHHQAHAYSSYFASGFDKSLVVTWDGRGEFCTGTVMVGNRNDLTPLKSQKMPISLGLMYSAFTDYLGFGFGDEYKVMGLASYGSPVYLDEFRKIFKADEKNIYDVEQKYFRHFLFNKDCGYTGSYYSDEVVKLWGEPRKEHEPLTQKHKDIAASMQARLNEVCVEIIADLVAETGEKNLCLAGGVALNGVANYHIYKESGIENIFIQPAAGDGGISLGAAYWGWHTFYKETTRLPFEHAYQGASYTDEEIEKELQTCGLAYKKMTDKPKTVAALLDKGYIIGLFQGVSEIGPRALGSRSIIADPRPAKHRDIVNSKIKFREEFRPFAPSVLEEYGKEYFNLDAHSPYMQMISEVNDEYKDKLQAVTHINGTARPQTVSKQACEEYYNIIEAFRERTGCAAILNTSFNVKGEPVVHSPTDAIRCFFSTGLDYLVLGDYLVLKNHGFPEVEAEQSVV